ncbi:Extradiol ring-cleavage dioxygenase class III protein subunit B [Thiomonas sp. X19]|uniref:dioxygenase family protein n=1 Tax=Thiomonas sp. X19 TaxID=1050370 RepID=UPI000B6F5F54|nr:class III extradiol ring-cleavage dioxygenase [Thiomonas sp. X19]SCC91242.1 Extradiol ring-cleavage dioxygenase class III protein subunit B [Thiomonas sp. X19]
MTHLPSLFVSHGSPMLPLEPGTAGPMLSALGDELPQPAAILAFSPHWMARIPAAGSSARPATIHDFGGFDPALHELRYPAAGNPELAQRAASLLQAAGWAAILDPGRGLDHGVWVPLRFMFPQADIPVVPLAMPWPLDAAGAYKLGQALAPLADEGVLLFGTGSLTHNLHEFRPGATTDEPPEPYVQEFADWMREAIDRGATASLLDYRRQAPHAARAHPSDEHLLPLFWALGAAGNPVKPQHKSGGVHYGMLSMDAWVLA